MAEAAEPAPLHRGLPDEIAVWEILVRLPPKPLLRCRAVCRAWRHATSARAFLLAHHRRQPSLPLLCGYGYASGGDGIYLDVVPFDHRAAAVDQLQPVARLGNTFFSLGASCDGLLVLADRRRLSNLGFSICNPATRQHARLHHLNGFALLGMYPHTPTGEYRLLLGKSSHRPQDQDGSYVFRLGSGEPLRRIRCPLAGDMVVKESSSVLFRGNLHWHLQRHQTNIIKVFNTTTESFHQMRAPALPAKANLFEMDGMLGMSSFNDEVVATIDIWMMQDYESEAWAFKCRVQLPIADPMVRFEKFLGQFSVVSSWDGDLLVLLQFSRWLLQIDMDGKVVTRFDRALHCADQLRLKQTLVPHAFFPTLEGYVVNSSPFM